MQVIKVIQTSGCCPLMFGLLHVSKNILFHFQENWTTIVDEHPHDVLKWCACVNEDILVMCYLSDVKVKTLQDLT